ncbi:MAG: hypothetical protein O2971_03765 [Proteobacteria bacterium]|nr:hypothetical protein [Pseudomonadota bacterium]
MQASLPVRLAESLIDSVSYPVLTTGCVFFVPVMFLFIASGSIYPAPDIQPWGDNPLEITGVFLLIAILPAYLMMCFVASTRQLNNTHAAISRLIDDVDEQERIRARGAGYWPLGVLLAAIFALGFNITWSTLSFNFADPRFAISACMVFGQVYLWAAVGLIVFHAIQQSMGLNQLGKQVRIDLYRLDDLNGFGRSSLNSFLMLVGALALTTLQSIDQTFRWENYANAFVVAIPAIFLIVPLPIWAIHLRIGDQKNALMAKLDEEIAQTSRALETEALNRMNALLLRREQIHKLRTWPMDLSIVTRFLLYVFIPPLAWAGTALMEVFLDNYLIG